MSLRALVISISLPPPCNRAAVPFGLQAADRRKDVLKKELDRLNIGGEPFAVCRQMSYFLEKGIFFRRRPWQDIGPAGLWPPNRYSPYFLFCPQFPARLYSHFPRRGLARSLRGSGSSAYPSEQIFQPDVDPVKRGVDGQILEVHQLLNPLKENLSKGRGRGGDQAFVDDFHLPGL